MRTPPCDAPPPMGVKCNLIYIYVYMLCHPCCTTQTEPYMPEYMKLDLNGALEDEGFELLEVRNTSPSHVAIVARKA